MASDAQVQSRASEEAVRGAIAQAFEAAEGDVVLNEPGSLVVELGSVGKAYLATAFRDKMKMPMRVIVTTAAGEGSIAVSVQVENRGGGGFFSGGIPGMIKARRAAATWLDTAVGAIPDRVG